jgi:hypothetical protein
MAAVATLQLKPFFFRIPYAFHKPGAMGTFSPHAQRFCCRRST